MTGDKINGARGTAYDRIIELLVLRDAKVRESDPGVTQATCPAHEDNSPSLRITKSEGHVLIHCHGGCTVEEILTELKWTKADLFDDRRGASYTYTDAHGETLRTVHRTPQKKFRQDIKVARVTLYRLPKIIEAVEAGELIYLVEGEKDVHAIEAVGGIATTAPMGASNFTKADLSPLHGAAVVAVVDADDAGMKWADQVYAELNGKAEELEFVQAKVGKDAADHIAAGYLLSDFELLTVEDEPSEYDFTPGGNFILDTDPDPQPIWGEGTDVVWADGEALIICGPQGAGKTTLAQQLVLGCCGFKGFETLLGLPIVPCQKRVLYLAMDRPRQAARSFRRMIREDQRDELNGRLVIWQGPPPQDMAQNPQMLLELCREAGADTVVIDSLKDAALGLSEDEVGAAYNRARQTAIAAGVQVLELHHIRKALSGAKAVHPAIDDVYGSTWITSGAGSVVLLNGKPGDVIVGLFHLKQPMGEFGPVKVFHDHTGGRSFISEGTDLLELIRAVGQIDVNDAAVALYENNPPDKNQKEKARNRLKSLEKQGHIVVIEEGDVKTHQPTIWGPKGLQRGSNGHSRPVALKDLQEAPKPTLKTGSKGAPKAPKH